MSLESRLARLEAASGERCPCGNPEAVEIEAGQPMPEPCNRCGRPSVGLRVIEEVVDETGQVIPWPEPTESQS